MEGTHVPDLFLDVITTKEAGRFITATFFSSVDISSYLDFGSGQWKTNVPFGQYRQASTPYVSAWRWGQGSVHYAAEKTDPKRLYPEA